MDYDIAFHTGRLWGYLTKEGLDVLPTFDDEGNYRPMLDIKLPGFDPSEADGVRVRVEVIKVLKGEDS